MPYRPPLSLIRVRSLLRLETAMRDKNLSGRELAELVVTSPQTISAIRLGIRRRVRADLARRIEAVLGVEPGELFELNSPRNGRTRRRGTSGAEDHGEATPRRQQRRGEVGDD